MAPLIVVTGTGTGIGKTLVGVGLVRAWAKRVEGVLGFKPIESGGDEDGKGLERVSTFHVTRFTAPYLLMDAVSPHLAARREGRGIEIHVVRECVERIRKEVGALVIELAGGVFTPLSERTTNVDLISALGEDAKVCLVAANRLGVLHDVIAVREAARAHRVAIDAIVLSDTEQGDASTASNADELRNVLAPPTPIIGRLLRGNEAEAEAEAANNDTIARILAYLTR